MNVLGRRLIHSIYVRGSVATGDAVPGIADIDAVALTRRPVQQSQKAALRRARERLETSCAIATKYELPVIFLDSLLEDDRYYPWRFTLKTQSVCIYGDDISSTLPSFRLDYSTIVRLLEPIDKYVARARERLDGKADDMSYVQSRCSWIMKRLVRQGGLLVMEREGVFTRSLYHCYEMFAKHYPQKRSAMYKAMMLAIHPTADKQVIFRVLDSLGHLLSAETHRYIERNNCFPRAA